jgi:UDP-N-acetylmuramate: L-alanyl-gamma-D-glutamyl-meso-diaminopimelate ligase
VTVVDDFAHHPTAVRRTLEALAGRYGVHDGGGRRLVACFEPRSLTAGRAHLATAYVGAFAAAGAVLLAPVFHARRLGPDQLLDLEALAADLRGRGLDAHACASTDDLLARALELARAGDVLVTMSSGSFDRLPHRLLAELRAR